MDFSSIFHVSFRWIVKSKLFEIWKNCKRMFCSKLFELFKNQHLGNICCLICFCWWRLWTGKTHFWLEIHENARYPEHSKSLKCGFTFIQSLEMCSVWSNSTFMPSRIFVIESFFALKMASKVTFAEKLLKFIKNWIFHRFSMSLFVGL